MKRWQVILVVSLVAVFCGCSGILLGFAVGERIGSNAREVAAPPEMVDIVVAARPIEVGMVLTAEMLTTIPIPETSVTEVMILSPEDALGCIARYDIATGTPITRSMLYFSAP